MPDDDEYRNAVRDESVAVEPTEAIEADNLEDALIAIGTALGGKAPLVHVHAAEAVTLDSDDLDATDVKSALEELAGRITTLEAP